MTYLLCDLVTSSSRLYFCNLIKCFLGVKATFKSNIFHRLLSSSLLNISLLCQLTEGRRTVCGNIGFKGWFLRILHHCGQIVYIFGITRIPSENTTCRWTTGWKKSFDFSTKANNHDILLNPSKIFLIFVEMTVQFLRTSRPTIVDTW